jgi:hypothetical protein
MPRALIGPDVDVRVLCTATAQVPIASVDVPGAGVARWSFKVKGDPAFGLPQSPQQMSLNTFVTCQADSPQVALVNFNPPIGALPGSTFDAIATVHADDGSFADGTVKLHGEVAAAVLTVDKTSVDFGDVAPGAMPVIPLHFTAEKGDSVNLFLDPPPAASGPRSVVASYSYGPFVIMPLAPAREGSGPFNWKVTFMTDVPGDYSATVGWSATPITAACPPGADCPVRPVPPDDPPCDWTTTIMLHARVVGDGGADTDIAEASDGGTDLAPDVP